MKVLKRSFNNRRSLRRQKLTSFKSIKPVNFVARRKTLSRVVATTGLQSFRFKMSPKTRQSVTLKDVDQHKFVKAFAAFLKKSGKMKIPEWVDLVKTAKFKELAPYDENWYYTRCAALARHIYFRSPVGVGAVTKIFGGRKRNGVCPSHFCRSSGGVARKALQSLESAKLIEKTEGGRKLTTQGRRDLDRIAAQVHQKSKAAAAAAAAATGPVVVVPPAAPAKA